jgi:hypothetical protein
MHLPQKFAFTSVILLNTATSELDGKKFIMQNEEQITSLFDYQSMLAKINENYPDNIFSQTFSESLDNDYNDEFKTLLDNNTQLYPTSEITTKEFFLAFESVMKKHHINALAANDILKLFKAVLPKGSCLKRPPKSNILQLVINQICTECKTTLVKSVNEKININRVITCLTCKNELINFVTFRLK